MGKTASDHRGPRAAVRALWRKVPPGLLLVAALCALVPGAGGEPAAAQTTRDRERVLFPICDRGKRVTCVVDGDTIWYRGTKIRIADIDTPEVGRPRCPREAALGRRATARMRELLNAGPFSLEPLANGRTQDRFGRELKVITRDGRSLGSVLVREGLAARWGGPKRRWC
jgi:endonuclease YncB( thermonuclease family)